MNSMMTFCTVEIQIKFKKYLHISHIFLFELHNMIIQISAGMRIRHFFSTDPAPDPT